MEELQLGPNGGLIYCMEYLLENSNWLKEKIEEIGQDAYFIFDCPGQVTICSEKLFPPTYLGVD